MKKTKGICLILISLLWVSCSDQIVYHSYEHFSNEGWLKNDTVSLQLQITDSLTGKAEILFLVRNKANYLFQDFQAVVQHNLPDTTRWRYFKVGFTLADKDGRWYGSGIGGLYQASVSLGKENVSPGKYTFNIIHRMNDESLKGLSDIGILIKKDLEKKD